MAYIGKAPVNGFHSKQTLSTDGSTTTFTLDFTVAASPVASIGLRFLVSVRPSADLQRA